jgi:hypothetical protein
MGLAANTGLVANKINIPYFLVGLTLRFWKYVKKRPLC